jgi:2'-5' RNA ligase
METIRAFIAIELPAAIRQQLDALERQIQAAAGEPARRAVRWVPAGNIHLTLKFLGEEPAAKLAPLAELLQRESARVAPFEMQVGELGAFPNLRRPRVIWVGTQAPPALLALQQAIEAGARRLGYPAEERGFSPHLTLGRVNQSARAEETAPLARALGEMKVGSLGSLPVTAVHLFRSDLRSGGPVYTVLQRFPLSQTA